ncbi:MAG: hypothetical protein ABIH99_01615 [Candidatus Micrarchaeota archaeon]
MKNEQKIVIYIWLAFILYWLALVLLWPQLQGFLLKLIGVVLP